LLDAVKDRKTRDAVKSVLERLTGGGAKPATPDAATAAPASEPVAAGDGKTN
jgi:AsmA protein